MIEGLRPYPVMKDSGVPWLGEVPEHWEVGRLRNIVTRITSGSRGWSGYAADDGPLFIRIGNLTRTSMELKRQDEVRLKLPDDTKAEAARTVVKPGDLLLSITAFIGSVAVVPKDIGEAYISQHVACCRPMVGAVEPRWLGYVALSPIGQIHGQLCMCGGTKQGLSLDDVKNYVILHPPLAEQRNIVEFLDHADRRIRRYVRAKRKLIRLLEEQKRAVIHRAVTGGLDPNVPLKPSGFESLGDVPAHWEVKPAKFFYRETDERSATGSEELLSVSHITGVTPRRLKAVTMFMAESYAGHKLCRPGDLVINTMWAWMAALGVARQVGIVSPAYGVYRPLRNSPLLPEYADLLLRSQPYVNEYNCRSTGIQSSRLRLYPEQFLRIQLVCPPIDEQNAIIRHLEAATANLSRAIDATQREIALLNEYRTRLIADVVTGKLDVRTAAASLPDEADEPDEPAAIDVDSDDAEDVAEDDLMEASA